MFPPKMLFAHVSYTSFQIQTRCGKMLHKKKFYAHTNLKELKGTTGTLLSI